MGLWKPATLAHEQLVFPICQYSTCTLLGSIAVKIFPSSHFGTQVDLDFLTSTIDRGAARPCTAASVSFPLRYTHNFFAICLRRCWWDAPGWGLKNNCGSAPPEKNLYGQGMEVPLSVRNGLIGIINRSPLCLHSFGRPNMESGIRLSSKKRIRYCI